MPTDADAKEVIGRYTEAYSTAHPFGDRPVMVADDEGYHEKVGFEPVRRFTREQVEAMTAELAKSAPKPSEDDEVSAPRP